MSGLADFFERVAQLSREGQTFATATVVGRRPPVSAHLGDRAIVFADGRMEGFVGGACSREIIRKQALEALRTRRGRLVSIRPDPGAEIDVRPEHVAVRMTCASEGAVEVYVEPVAQPRLLVVVGATPIASAMTRVARSLDYRVVHVVDEQERFDLEPDAATLNVRLVPLDALDDLLGSEQSRVGTCAVVVASQGHYDEEALASALKAGAIYVGLVASRARGAVVRALLEEQGVPRVEMLRSPAGLDLGARTPPEVALSILAEIIQADESRAELEAVGAEAVATEAPASAVDPVCGMDVDVATARHMTDVDGITYYFCSAGCRSRFLKQPAEYLSRTS
jgi:xanthine dehydrogenase accessory factor